MKKRLSAYELALSAVACAVATLALTLGAVYPPLRFTGYLFGCLAVMLPLACGYYVGAALCYLGGTLLALIFSGFRFIDLTPFAMFFGLHPIVNALQKKFRVNKYLSYAVKAVWFDVSAYLTWKLVFSMNTALPFLDKYILPIVLIGGTLFFIAYDILIFRTQAAVDAAVEKYIGRKRK